MLWNLRKHFFYLLPIIFAMSSFFSMRLLAESHDRPSTTRTILKYGGAAVGGYLVGRAIENYRDRAAAREASKLRLWSENYRPYYYSNGGYDDDDRYDYIPSPANYRKFQTKVTEEMMAPAVKELNEQMNESNLKAATELLKAEMDPPKYICYALCGGYWNGKTYRNLEYDSNYYGKAVIQNQIVSLGESREEAFEKLKNYCPSDKFKILDPNSYDEVTVFEKPLSEGNQSSVCIENTRSAYECTANCIATPKKDPTKPLKEQIKGVGNNLAASFLHLFFNEGCLLKYGDPEGKNIAHIEHLQKISGVITPANSCTMDKTREESNQKTTKMPPPPPSPEKVVKDAYLVCLGREAKPQEVPGWANIVREKGDAFARKGICESDEATRHFVSKEIDYSLGHSASEQEISHWADLARTKGRAYVSEALQTEPQARFRYFDDPRVSCAGDVCTMAKKLNGDSCVQAIKRSGMEDMVYFQFGKVGCPEDKTLLSSKDVIFQLEGSSTLDPFFVEKSKDPDSAKRFQALNFPIPLSGYLYWTTPKGERIRIGTWFEAKLPSANKHFPYLTSLCSKKDSLSFPDFGKELDFSSRCKVEIKNGAIVGILPSNAN